MIMSLGTVIHEFPVMGAGPKAVALKGVENVASYSWLDEARPAISVPGCPRVWTNALPRRVPADWGLVWLDENTGRLAPPAHPLAPLFAAVDHLDPEYDFDSLDLIADREDLQKLLRWTSGGAGSMLKWRIEVDCLGDAGTVLLTRREGRNWESRMGLSGVFEEEYKKAATKPAAEELKAATGHFRIVELDLGGLKVLMRFKVDAVGNRADWIAAPGSDDTEEAEGDTSFATALEELGISLKSSSETCSPPPAPSFPGLTVCRTTQQRSPTPYRSLVELAVRPASSPFKWHEEYPALYLSQTPWIYIAKHEHDAFFEVQQVAVLADGMARYRAGAELAMGRLRKVLREILKIVRAMERGKRHMLICEGGKLRLYERVGDRDDRVLGEAILGRF